MDSNDLNELGFYTTDGKDIWEMTSYCSEPSCELKNLKTGEVKRFGMGGLMAKSFHKIEMPIQAKK